MPEYDHYLNYTNDLSELRERVERTQRTKPTTTPRRSTGRHALARGLHSLADRLDG